MWPIIRKKWRWWTVLRLTQYFLSSLLKTLCEESILFPLLWLSFQVLVVRLTMPWTDVIQKFKSNFNATQAIPYKKRFSRFLSQCPTLHLRQCRSSTGCSKSWYQQLNGQLETSGECYFSGVDGGTATVQHLCWWQDSVIKCTSASLLMTTRYMLQLAHWRGGMTSGGTLTGLRGRPMQLLLGK